MATLGTIGVLTFAIVGRAMGLAEARNRDSVHELEGCLHTLHATLRPDPCKLRLAVHVPVNDSLEQVTE